MEVEFSKIPSSIMCPGLKLLPDNACTWLGKIKKPKTKVVMHRKRKFNDFAGDNIGLLNYHRIIRPICGSIGTLGRKSNFYVPITGHRKIRQRNIKYWAHIVIC